MYPGQQLHNEVREQVVRACLDIVDIANVIMQSQSLNQHHVVFPLFLAATATPDFETRLGVIRVLQSMEGTGSSQNSLFAVLYAQSWRGSSGGQDKSDWIKCARLTGMDLVGFYL